MSQMTQLKFKPGIENRARADAGDSLYECVKVQAPKERKNPAHGASRGEQGRTPERAPEGRKTETGKGTTSVVPGDGL